MIEISWASMWWKVTSICEVDRIFQTQLIKDKCLLAFFISKPNGLWCLCFIHHVGEGSLKGTLFAKLGFRV